MHPKCPPAPHQHPLASTHHANEVVGKQVWEGSAGQLGSFPTWPAVPYLGQQCPHLAYSAHQASKVVVAAWGEAMLQCSTPPTTQWLFSFSMQALGDRRSHSGGHFDVPLQHYPGGKGPRSLPNHLLCLLSPGACPLQFLDSKRQEK